MGQGKLSENRLTDREFHTSLRDSTPLGSTQTPQGGIMTKDNLRNTVS